MIVRRTIKIKLNIAKEEILPTIQAYTNIFNYITKYGFDKREYNGIEIHKATYRATRQYLPSQLAISARMKAVECLKSVRARIKKGKKVSCPISKQCSVRYDARSYKVWFGRNEISLLTTNGRIKIPIIVPEYFKRYTAWKTTSADLFIKKSKIFLNIAMEIILPDIPLTDKVIGIDRGINKIAVTSDNIFYKGNHIKKVCKKYQKIRSALQSKGSKSAKRHLKELSKREQRFKADTNHCIAKSIINSLPIGSTIVLEDLKYIRDRAKLRKKARTLLNNWSFYQFEQFLKYKGEIKGIVIEYVDARYTSQKCCKCSHIEKGNRVNQAIFKCKKCGYQMDADLNASRNIRQNYLDSIGYPSRAVVNQPIVAEVNQYDSPVTSPQASPAGN